MRHKYAPTQIAHHVKTTIEILGRTYSPYASTISLKALVLKDTMPRLTNSPTYLTPTQTHDTSHTLMSVTNTIHDKTTPFYYGTSVAHATMHNAVAFEKLQPNIVYIRGATYEQQSPLIFTPNLTIQIIEFTFTYGRFLDQGVQTKEDKYNPSIMSLEHKIKGVIYNRSIELLKNLNNPKSLIKKTMKAILQIAIKYFTYHVLNKRKLDNK